MKVLQQIIEEIKDYSPEIILLAVNKRINSKYYRQNNKKEVKNPFQGSVIYNDMSANNQIDFLLTPQNVEVGCANPIQYRLVFYKQKGKGFQ